jgi:hypothetical protein
LKSGHGLGLSAAEREIENSRKLHERRGFESVQSIGFPAFFIIGAAKAKFFAKTL